MAANLIIKKWILIGLLFFLSQPAIYATVPTASIGFDWEKVGWIALGLTELYFLSENPSYLGGGVPSGRCFRCIGH